MRNKKSEWENILKADFRFKKIDSAKLLFAVYAAFMLWLLLGRGISRSEDYWAQVQSNLNVIPLRTVTLYVRLLKNATSPYLIRHAVVNLVGNVVMFIPMGLLMPVAVPWAKTGRYFFLMTVCLVCLVELVQLFTLTGSCDVDDLLLNVVGAAIGYRVFSFSHRKRHRSDTDNR